MALTKRLRGVSLSLLLLTAYASAQPATPRPYATAIEGARGEVRTLMTAQAPPGMSVAVAVDGKVVWSEGFGFADLEHQTAASPSTRYRLGSVSKLFTAAIATRLAARNVVDLDAPVQRYVTTFPDQHAPVTLRQLLGHLGGVRHYGPNDPVFGGTKPYASLSEGLAIFQNDPLLSPPGTAYTYTSYGYNLLGVALEKAGGKDFGALLAQEVTTPLGLTTVALDDNAAVVRGRTSFYDRASETAPIRNANPNDSSYKWPSGGIIASAEDIVLFASAWLRPGFLPEALLSETFTPQKLANGTATNVGLGWRIGRTADGTTYYHHGGTITGGRAFVLVLPEKRIAVAILANLLVRYDENEALAIANQFAAGSW